MTKTKTKNPKTDRTLEPIGLEEMKTVAGGEVSAVLAGLRSYCDSYGMSCTGNAEMAGWMYGGR
jgi:hypothetical protein